MDRDDRLFYGEGIIAGGEFEALVQERRGPW